MTYDSKRIKPISIGTKFGKLKVVDLPKKHTTGKTTRAMFKCRCDCGEETFITGSQLRGGKRLQCSNCAYKTRPQSTMRLSNLERMFSLHILSRCKTDKLKNELTIEEYENLIKQNCYYCDASPRKISHLDKNRIALREDFYANGIDRINSLGHYTIDNCVPCCKQCNTMKMNYTKDEFFNKIKTIYNKWKKQEDTIKVN